MARDPGRLVLWPSPELMLDSDGWPCQVVGEWRHPLTGGLVGYAGFRASILSSVRAVPGAMGVHGAPAAPFRNAKD